MVLGSGLDVLLGAGLGLVSAEGDDQHERHAGEGDDGLSKAGLKRVGSRTRPCLGSASLEFEPSVAYLGDRDHPGRPPGHHRHDLWRVRVRVRFEDRIRVRVRVRC